jgi:serine/threonine protein kinase
MSESHGAYSTVEKDKINGLALKHFKDKNSNEAIREIAIMNYLKHPNIISLIDAKIDNNNNWTLYMKLYDLDISGTTIHDLRLFLTIARDILSGLYFMYQKRVIHADLKPQNILYSIDDNRAVICDFNLSVYSPEDLNRAQVQTPIYRAPEININKILCNYDHRIDIWSFGCIIYELLTDSYFMPLNICEQDITISLSKLYKNEIIENLKNLSPKMSKLPDLKVRKNRKQLLNGIIEAQLISKFIIKLKQSKSGIIYELKNKISNELHDKFINRMSNLLAKCLIPSKSSRINIIGLCDEFNKLFDIFQIKKITMDLYDLPISLMNISFSDEIKRIILESSEQNVLQNSKQNHKNYKINELMLLREFVNITKILKCPNIYNLYRLLENEYYRVINIKKLIGSFDSILITSCCIYIVCCIYSIKPPDEIYFGLDYKYILPKIYKKCSDIIFNLNNKLIY